MKNEYIKHAEQLYTDYIKQNPNSKIKVEIFLSEINYFGSKIQYPQYSIVNIQ